MKVPAFTSLLASLQFACATPPHAPPAPTLLGTDWQLVRVLYMNDEIVRADQPERYTLRLEADGSVALRLDCNRGRGSWQGSGASGLRFTSLSATRAECPPGSLYRLLSKDLPMVRSFVIRDGRLHLALMADGGILEFRAVGRAD